MASWPQGNMDSILSYQTPLPHHRARTRVMLAGIFNTVLAGLNFLGGLGWGAMTAFMWYLFDKMAHMPATTYPGGPAAPPPTTMPKESLWLILGIYAGGAVLSLVVAVVQLIAGIKLLRRRRSAWAWAIAAGVVSCTELWFSVMCVIPLASGVFTLVVCFMPGTREYLVAEEQVRATGAGATVPPAL